MTTEGGFTAEEQALATRLRRRATALSLALVPVWIVGYNAVLPALRDWDATHGRALPWSVAVVGYALALQLLVATFGLLTAVAFARVVAQPAGLRVRRAPILPGVIRAWSVDTASLLVGVLLSWWGARHASLGWLVAGPVFAGLAVFGNRTTLWRARAVKHLEPLRDPRCLRLLAELRSADTPEFSMWLHHQSRSGPQVNAFVARSGATNGLVVFDTALALPDPELRALLAHELGHIELDHLRIGGPRHALAEGAVALAAMAIAGIVDPAASPALSARQLRSAPIAVIDFIIFLWFGRVLVGPVLADGRRKRERAADEFALERTRDPHAFSSMIRAVTVRSGIDPRRSGLECSHPASTERIELARRWAADHEIAWLPDAAPAATQLGDLPGQAPFDAQHPGTSEGRPG